MAGKAGKYDICFEQGVTFDELHVFRFTNTRRPAFDFSTAVEHRAYFRPVEADEDLNSDEEIVSPALAMTSGNGRIVYEPTIVSATAVTESFTMGESTVEASGADFFGAGVKQGDLVTLAGGPFDGTYYVRMDPTEASPDVLDLEDVDGVQVSWATTEVAAGTVAVSNTARVRFTVDSDALEALTLEDGVWDYEVDYGGLPPVVNRLYKGVFTNIRAATKDQPP